MSTWFVLGSGYTGSRLVERLLSDAALVDDDVVITRRAAADAAGLAASYASRVGRDGTPRVRAVACDLATAAPSIPDAAIVVCTAPPGKDVAAETQRLVEATRNAKRLIYVSSTGVYGPGHGAWVDESSPIAPITASGRARAAAEAALLGRSTPPTIALRAAGIHGPGRGLVDRIRAGTYRIVGDGTAHVSRIHVDDLVEAIMRAGTTALAVMGAVNIADDEPAPIGIVADELAAQLGKPPPPRVLASSVDAEVAGMLTANRRIANTRMKNELGVVLRYPSWRDAI